MTIYFYGAKEVPYGCFSNFSPHGFMLDDKYWATSEHYFQGQKFAGTPHIVDVIRAPSPKQAASIGRDRSRPLRPDWNDVKEDIMMQGVYAKFTRHQDICQILLDTGDEHLVENSPIDTYWGCGKDGSGKNRMGHILVALREHFRQEGHPRTTRSMASKTAHLPELRTELDYRRTFSAEEYVQLRRGFLPLDMDDRWFIFMEDDWLYFHRSWTGNCIFQIRLELDNAGYTCAETRANRDPEQYTCTSDKSDCFTINNLIEKFLLNRKHQTTTCLGQITDLDEEM